MLDKDTELLDRERHMSNYNLEVLLRRLNRKVSVIMWILIVFSVITISCWILVVIALSAASGVLFR